MDAGCSIVELPVDESKLTPDFPPLTAHWESARPRFAIEIGVFSMYDLYCKRICSVVAKYRERTGLTGRMSGRMPTFYLLQRQLSR
jgi:hypothetical protein